MKPKCCVCGIEDPIPTEGKISNVVYWYRYLGDNDSFKTIGIPVEDREDLFQEIEDKLAECDETSLFLCPVCLEELTIYAQAWDFSEEDEDIYGDEDLRDVLE